MILSVIYVFFFFYMWGQEVFICILKLLLLHCQTKKLVFSKVLFIHLFIRFIIIYFL